MIDTMLVEHDALTDDAKRRELEAEMCRYVIHRGPFVLDHSHLDMAVRGRDKDEARLSEVFTILRPGVPDRATAIPNDVRDAMHIATSIRYGEIGFITNDELVLRKDPAIRAAFNGFGIYSPARALATAQRFVERSKISQPDVE